MTRALWSTVLAIMIAAWAPAGLSSQVDEQPRPFSAGADARIQPGDQVVLQIWREPDMSGSFTVDENGDLILPRIGTVNALSMSAATLQDSLRTEFARYLRNPSVDVAVLRRIGVHGEVRNPDLYMVDLTMTLREVIARAGGITEAGNPNKITIIRGEEQIRLGERRRADFVTAELRSGDQVVVGRRSWMAMNPLAVISTGTALVSFFVGVILPLID